MSLSIRGLALAIVMLGLLLAGCSLLRQGGEYPAREITYIVPYPPGGGADLLARAVTQEAEPLVKQRFVVVNKPSPAGTIGMVEVIQAKPDGYTIGSSLVGPAAIQPLLEKLPYSTPEDYQPIIKLIEQSATLVVRADAPWKTLDEFVADAKKRPGQIRIATAGSLTLLHLTTEKLKQVTKLDVTVVPLVGSEAEAVRTLLGGHVEAMVTYPTAPAGQIKAGQLRLLATIDDRRNPLFPEVPATAESGYKVRTPVTQFVVGPKGLDRAVVDKLNRVFNEAMKTPKFQEFAKTSGFVIDPLGPAELAKEIGEYGNTYAELLRELGIEMKR